MMENKRIKVSDKITIIFIHDLGSFLRIKFWSLSSPMLTAANETRSFFYKTFQSLPGLLNY